MEHISCLVLCLTLANAAKGSCVNIPDDPQHGTLARFCEDYSRYSFDLSGDRLVFSKKAFQTKLSDAISSWWSNHDLDERDLIGAPVEVWLSIPESNPQAAQARAVLFSPLGNISLSFDLHDFDWEFVDDRAGMLDSYTYPESYGWRPRQVLINLNPNVDKDSANQLLADAGITMVLETTPGWYLATSKIFDESSAIERLAELDRNRHMIKSAQLNKLFEWIAVRGKTVHFSMTDSTARDQPDNGK